MRSIGRSVRSVCNKIFVLFRLLLPFGQWAYGESRVQKNRERNAANKIRDNNLFLSSVVLTFQIDCLCFPRDVCYHGDTVVMNLHLLISGINDHFSF